MKLWPVLCGEEDTEGGQGFTCSLVEDHDGYVHIAAEGDSPNGRVLSEWPIGDTVVTCDGCDNVDTEGGWGDTPFCVDCHTMGRATEGALCVLHQRTYYGKCPLHEISDAQALQDRVAVRSATDVVG